MSNEPNKPATEAEPVAQAPVQKTAEELIAEKQKEMLHKKLKIGAYIALVLIIVLFSGLFTDSESFMKGYDFTNWIGAFGKIKEGGVFTGSGGTGARHGFLLSINVAPAMFLAMGCVAVFERLGAIDAAGKLLSFVLRPVMGVPGYVAIPMIASLTSSDAGASLNRQFFEGQLLTRKERDITTMWLLCGAGLLTNYITAYTFVMDIVTVPFIVPFLFVLFMKFVEANAIRFIWGWLDKPKKNKADTAKGAEA